MNCFPLLDGSKIWEFRSDDDFIKSQKKLSIVFDEKKFISIIQEGIYIL